MGNTHAKGSDSNGETSLNDFRLLRVVGRGAFGKVRIVEKRDTGLTFALKYIRKDEVVRSESVRNIIRERRMLEQVSHPFLCNLRYSFQDMEYMYLIVDLMTGGDLRYHISRKAFTEDTVRFWIAELGCALRYIHRRGIVHRDIKPDNVLLDGHGHVHLTDFNVASDIVHGSQLTSKSGTLAYLAPEVYAGTGYDIRVDWWSLGVLFYECIYNKRPFDATSESTLSVQVQAGVSRYPLTQPAVSADCLHAMSSALDLDRDRRMGSTWSSFIHNPFFSCIDFRALERQDIEPVFVPAAHKTNFDATYDLEELLLEEAPLEARARRSKPREQLKDDATHKEIRHEELYRMIETDFQPFDYTIVTISEKAPDSKSPSPPPVATASPNRPSIQSPAPVHTAGDHASSTASRPSVPVRSHHRPYARAPPPPPLPLLQRPLHSSGACSPNELSPPLLHCPGIALPPKSARRSPHSSPAPDGGSWFQDAAPAAVPADSSRGVLGFLSRKKGRGSSPKPRERGVLGKEGARAIVG